MAVLLIVVSIILQVLLKLVMDIYILTQLRASKSEVLFSLPNWEVLLPVSAIYLTHSNFLRTKTKMQASTDLRETFGN